MLNIQYIFVAYEYKKEGMNSNTSALSSNTYYTQNLDSPYAENSSLVESGYRTFSHIVDTT